MSAPAPAPAPLNAGFGGRSASSTADRAELIEAGYSLRAVFDHEPVADAAVCNSFEELIARKDLDVIVLAHFQIDQLCAALEAGKHVISSSPNTLSVDDAERIAKAERTRGRAVAFSTSRLRCGGYTNLAREYLRAGRVGRIYRVELILHGANPSAPLSLLDQTLELLNWPQIQTLCARSFPSPQAAKAPPALLENGTVFARLAGDIAMTLDVSTNPLQRPRHSITILGDKGGLVIDHSEGGREFCFIEEAPVLLGKLIESKLHFKLEPWGSLFRAFREHIVSGAPRPGTTAEQTRQLAVWCQMIRDSAKEGRELPGAPRSAA